MKKLSAADGRVSRVAYFATHPIQYQAPLLRYLAADPQIDLEVFFYSDFSLHEHFDPGYGVEFKWDVPLVQGYNHSFLPRLFRNRKHRRKSWNPALGIKSVLRNGKFNALWVHGWAHVCSLQAIFGARSLGLPVLLRGESLPDHLCPGDRRRLFARLSQTALLRRASGFLCSGSANRRFYLERKVPADRLFLMPYAVDNHFFQQQAMAASPRRKTLRARLGLDPERAIILFTGRFSNVKGADILLDAVSKLITPAADSRFHSDCSRLPYLLFIGDGPMRSDLEFRAKALPAGTVHFLGFKNQTELPAFYDLCDLFVLPSRFEPWGLVVNEVMNAGRPVIVSDRVGAGFDLVEPGLNGWIYPHEESQALANCLRQALADRERLRDMGRRSLERISTWDFESDRRSFLAALKKLLPP